jgi:hypothetical protein
VLELDHITVLDPEPLFPTMRPPWLQPADRLGPMPEEQRARMWCSALMIAGFLRDSSLKETMEAKNSGYALQFIDRHTCALVVSEISSKAEPTAARARRSQDGEGSL